MIFNTLPSINPLTLFTSILSLSLHFPGTIIFNMVWWWDERDLSSPRQEFQVSLFLWMLIFGPPQTLSLLWPLPTEKCSSWLPNPQGSPQLPHPPNYWRVVWILHQHHLQDPTMIPLSPPTYCRSCLRPIHSSPRLHQPLPHICLS